VTLRSTVARGIANTQVPSYLDNPPTATATTVGGL
jgi:hypothetical protein